MEGIGGGHALLDAVDPVVYRRNGFRLTGLAVDATAAQVRRRGEQMTALAKLGGAAPVQPGTLLPLEPAPAADAVQAALDELRSPDRRVIHELFWFWPMPATDPGTTHLRAGEFEQAAAAWRDLAARGDAVALHNVAVLAHALALDAEATGGPAENFWLPALSFWRQVADEDSCWRWLDARVAELADPRVGPATVGELRAALPGALLRVNSTLAIRALESGAEDRAGRQLQYIDRSGFPGGVVRTAYEAVAVPVVEQVRRETRRAVGSIDRDQATARTAAEELTTRTESSLRRIDVLYPSGGTTRDAVRDDVALALLQTAIAGQGGAMPDAMVRDVINHGVGVAATESARTRLRENLEIIEGNIESKAIISCWFCGQPMTSADDAHAVELYNDVVRRSRRMTWNSKTVRLPQCASCRASWDSKTLVEGLWALLTVAAGIGFVVCLLVSLSQHTPWAVLVDSLVLAVALVFGVPCWRATARIRQRANQYPPLADLFKQGWRRGKPSK